MRSLPNTHICIILCLLLLFLFFLLFSFFFWYFCFFTWIICEDSTLRLKCMNCGLRILRGIPFRWYVYIWLFFVSSFIFFVYPYREKAAWNYSNTERVDIHFATTPNWFLFREIISSVLRVVLFFYIKWFKERIDSLFTMPTLLRLIYLKRWQLWRDEGRSR